MERDARGLAIEGWFLFLSEQEQLPDERRDWYRVKRMPEWLSSGIEEKFAGEPPRVITLK